MSAIRRLVPSPLRPLARQAVQRLKRILHRPRVVPPTERGDGSGEDGPALLGVFRSEREWRQWTASHAGQMTPEVSQEIVAHALRHGITTPMFGHTPASEVRMAGDEPREALLVMGLNARLRATLQVLAAQSIAHETWNARIYAHEALTPFALAMRGRYPRFVGSEFARDEEEARAIWPVPAVDIMRSPFPDASFDIVLTNEVLEHIPDLMAGLRDTARILRPGGKLIGTFPFAWESAATEIRARVTPGGIEHLHPPGVSRQSGGPRGRLPRLPDPRLGRPGDVPRRRLPRRAHDLHRLGAPRHHIARHLWRLRDRGDALTPTAIFGGQRSGPPTARGTASRPVGSAASRGRATHRRQFRALTPTVHRRARLSQESRDVNPTYRHGVTETCHDQASAT